MRFSFAIVLVVVAALTSSTSAAPIDDQACPLVCRKNSVCHVCEEYREFQWFPGFNHDSPTLQFLAMANGFQLIDH
jgi:hypothetical protein